MIQVCEPPRVRPVRRFSAEEFCFLLRGEAGSLYRPRSEVLRMLTVGLDEEVLSGAVNAIRHADTLIIGGTSLVVYPAAGLIRYFRGDHLVVINMQPTNADAEADLCIAKPIGQVLSEDVVLDD